MAWSGSGPTSPPDPLSLAGEGAIADAGDCVRDMGRGRTGRRGLVTRSRVRPEKAELARALRRASTEAERVAWELLRGRRTLGLKFRRQQAIAGFVVDFYCAELRLVFELDGAVHESPANREYDAARSRVLQSHGVRVVRIHNTKLDAALLEGILHHAMQSRDAGSPLARQGEGGWGGEVVRPDPRTDPPEAAGERQDMDRQTPDMARQTADMAKQPQATPEHPPATPRPPHPTATPQ